MSQNYPNPNQGPPMTEERLDKNFDTPHDRIPVQYVIFLSTTWDAPLHPSAYLKLVGAKK